MHALSNPTIRPATDADGEAVGRVLAACFAEYPGCLYVEDEFPEFAALASHYARRGGRVWVAETGAGLIGSFAVAPTRDPAVHEINKVYLAPGTRGRGTAAAMLALACAFAAEAGAARVRLWTDTRFTDAHRFYERNGFVRLPGERYIGDASHSWEYGYLRALDGQRR